MTDPTDRFLRMGTDATDLASGNFFVRGLPRPTAITFNDHSSRRDQGGGGEGRHGHNNATVLWGRLTAAQATVIRTLIETAETSGGQGNGTLWLTIPKTSDTGRAWIDISGIAIMPTWEPTEGGFGLVFENVQLRLNDVTIQNEPSTVV